MRVATVLLVAFACSGAFASEPGQPLDCSDWVFLRPGFSCTDIVPFPCLDPSGNTMLACNSNGFAAPIDNAGRQFFGRVDWVSDPLDCGGYSQPSHKRVSIWMLDGSGVQSLLAFQDERCGVPGSGNSDQFSDNAGGRSVTFDAVNGVLRIATDLYCYPGNCYQSGSRLMAIHGFATLFDVLQTYTAQASLGFRVPYMPEGMAGADHFDTYWGNLTHPLDFTQAHPLACDYPAAAPHVGDYLTVADTVPTPAPGQGVYYVTAATYQGATRYGRKTTAGHLSGRDPAVLPACGP